MPDNVRLRKTVTDVSKEESRKREEDTIADDNTLLIAVDLDRVVIECDERFVLAEAQHPKGSADYWQSALDPEKMLLLDRPLPGAIEQLLSISQHGKLCYVTSRPQNCHHATVTFLETNGYPFPQHTVCRPVRRGLTSVRFKKLTIQALSCGLSASFINQYFRLATNKITLFILSRLRRPMTVLFIDDSDKNRHAIAEMGMRGVASLDEAMAWLHEGGCD